MNISSTPFIRNDYWPDYNDINQLNQRINEAENETALVNARLTNDIENVSANLNSYMDNQADTVITNNIIVNSLNANYAIGRYANFANTNTDNAYVENLTVNKPVFDLTLNTPHIENATSLGGNFYNANLINPSFEEIGSMNLNTLNVNTANIKELFINTQPEPITSSAVLGYDSEGRVIPIHAAYDVGFPEDANYLFTDHAGTAFAGTAATEVGISSNLITAHAVKNAIDNVTADVSDNFNIINDALNDVDSWMNNIENDVNNRFEDVANNFNDVNNGFNDVANNFANIDNNFNDVANNFNYVNNGFNDVANELNEANNTINSLRNTIRILSVDDANYYWSGAPVNYKNVTLIKFELDGNAGTQISGKRFPVNMVFNDTSNTLEFHSEGFEFDDDNFVTVPESLLQIFNSDISYLFENCRQLNYLGNKENDEFDFNFCEPTGNFITNMSHTFEWCVNFNQPVQIPNSVTDMSGAFANCFNFNQNIQIPNSVTNIANIFEGCNHFDQNIQIPDSVTEMAEAFYRCNVLNQNIQIPDSVTNISWTFGSCNILNQNIQLSDNVVDMSGTFAGCYNFDQNIQIPDSVTMMHSTFANCYNFNQNILLPNSATEITSCFRDCNNLSQSILIPNSVTRMGWTFDNCSSLRQSDMYIYSQNITKMDNAFKGCHINNIHIPTSVPKSTSNFMYNCLVNGRTGITFPAANIFNDLPVDIEQWPPL